MVVVPLDPIGAEGVRQGLFIVEEMAVDQLPPLKKREVNAFFSTDVSNLTRDLGVLNLRRDLKRCKTHQDWQHNRSWYLAGNI